jgi:site-specific recombinase XerD
MAHPVIARAEGGRDREDWTPRELRHSVVSIFSDNGISMEAVADLVGHRTTVVTHKRFFAPRSVPRTAEEYHP